MRIQYWSFLLNEEGQPIENAEVWVYLAGTTTAADLYSSENGVYSSSPYQLTFNSEEGGSQNIVTDANGFFNFWIGDMDETNGYQIDQKFKLKWYKANITEGSIDNITILFFNGISFTQLIDTPNTYTNAGALYNINDTEDGIQETSVILNPGINNFSLTNGTSMLTISGDYGTTILSEGQSNVLTIENDSILNQDLTTNADVDFNSITLNAGTGVTEFSTDITLAGNSDDAVPTEKAIKTYVDNNFIAGTNVTYNNSDTTITLTTSDLNEILLVENASDVVINLPSIDSGDIGKFIKIHKMGVGNMTINRADSDTIENSTVLSNTISTEIWSNVALFVGTATKWKIDGAPFGTWVNT